MEYLALYSSRTVQCEDCLTVPGGVFPRAIVSSSTMDEITYVLTALPAKSTDAKIPKGAPLLVATWSNGLLVEAAVAETVGDRLIPGEGQILFVSDLSEKDRVNILADSDTSSHPDALALRRWSRHYEVPVATLSTQHPLPSGHGAATVPRRR